MRKIAKFFPVATILTLVVLLFSGCTVPSWVPFIGQEAPTEIPEETPGVTGTPAATPTVFISDLSTVDPLLYGDVSENYALAQEKAALWHSNAKLYHFSVKIPISLQTNAATETYVFGSTSEPNSWWTISIAQQSGKYVRAEIPKADYLSKDLKVAETKFWNTNWLQTFQLADENGGVTLRQQGLVKEITVDLTTGQPKGWLWWEVHYKKADGTEKIFRIDPNKGQLVNEITGQPITTTATPTPGIIPTETEEPIIGF